MKKIAELKHAFKTSKHEIGDLITVRWATRDDEYEFEPGRIMGWFVDEYARLHYSVLIEREIKTIPKYQID